MPLLKMFKPPGRYAVRWMAEATNFSCIWPDLQSRRHPNSCPDEASNPEMACAFQKHVCHMWVKHGETP